MQGRLGRAGAALMCTLGAAGAVGAQGAKADTAKTAAKACDATVTLSDALGRATFSLDRAFRALQRHADARRDLKDAIHALTTPPKDKNERADSAGRAYYLGQAYILMLQVPGVKPIGRRGDFGIATDTVLSIDLLAAADTAFTKAAQGIPACTGDIAKWRQQKPWLDLLNTAITAMNANQFDTAAVLAKRTLVIDRSTPYPYTIMANAAANRKDYAAAVANLKQALAIAATDTAYNDVRISGTSQLANMATQLANATTGTDKGARVQEAIADWQNLIPTANRDVQVANAEQMIVQLYKSVGDTTKLPEAYGQVIANPSKFGEQALLNAGVIATRARKPDDAVKLFAAVLDQNPNQRDALNNLAASYVEAKQPDKILPLAERLSSLEPNNPEAWRFYAYAYTGLLKRTKDPKQVKLYTDSLVKYNNKANGLTTVVSLNEFSQQEKATTVSGTIKNLGKTTKSYTLSVDFLDKSGTVVNSQTASVGPVSAAGDGSFTLTAPVAGVVAFRYKPLS